MIQTFLRGMIRIPQVIRFLFIYAKALIIANLWVAYAVLSPLRHMKPGIIAIPLDVQSDLEILSLANLITMTPGTLSVDISEDKRILYVHAMFIKDVEGLRHEIKSELEKPVMELFK